MVPNARGKILAPPKWWGVGFDQARALVFTFV
jgi:hypothetical protein